MSDAPQIPPSDHEAFEADFSDYYERSLGTARRQELDAHFASCARCREDYARFRETMQALSGLHRQPAPEHFDEHVAETINRRSAGRFFGRRAFGDRVPFELLAVIGLLLLVGVFFMVRWSTTGSVHEPLQRNSPPAPTSPEIKEVLSPP